MTKKNPLKKPAAPPIEPLRTATPDKECVGYSHHFQSEPIGAGSYSCQCGIFTVRINNTAGRPLEIEPSPELNPDKKLKGATNDE